ncbi:MAG: HEPN domain-containing protein, partial [Nitrospinae bacterium]|nr:HEPN domain-containing protein [Nitrospinota bacterium]
ALHTGHSPLAQLRQCLTIKPAPICILHGLQRNAYIHLCQYYYETVNISGGRNRHGLFFVHLALEKILKAHVCKFTNDIPPKSHNIIKLAELAGIELTGQQKADFNIINGFNIEGRYAEELQPPPTKEQAAIYFKKAEEIFRWLTRLL